MKPQLLPEKLEPLRSILIEPLPPEVIKFINNTREYHSIIYFLINNNEIVYIGKTLRASTLLGRIEAHLNWECAKSSGELYKSFERILLFYIKCENAALVELALIKFFKPKYNGDLIKKAALNSSEIRVLEKLLNFSLDQSFAETDITIKKDERIGISLYKKHSVDGRPYYYYSFSVNNDRYTGTLSSHMTLDEAQETVDKKKKTLKNG